MRSLRALWTTHISVTKVGYPRSPLYWSSLSDVQTDIFCCIQNISMNEIDYNYAFNERLSIIGTGSEIMLRLKWNERKMKCKV